MARVVAFGPEGRRFESTKGYTPDRDMCARRQVCSRHTVSLDIGLSHPHTPGIIHDDAHTIALPSVCRYRLVIIAKVVEDLLCMKFMWLQCDAAGIARRVALVARPSLITLKSSSCTYLLFKVYWAITLLVT